MIGMLEDKMCDKCKDEWQELRKELFTPEEIIASNRRVEAMHKADLVKGSVKPKTARAKVISRTSS